MERIILYTNTFPPEFGAAPSRLFDMVKALQNAGNTVEVFTSVPNYPTGKIAKEYKGLWFKTETINGIKVHRHWQYASHSNHFHKRFLSMFSLAFIMLFSLKKAIQLRPTIIITQYPPIAVPLIAKLCARLSKARLIINASDLWSFALSNLEISAKQSLLSNAIRKYENWLFKNANQILVQSEETKVHLEGKYGIKTKLYPTGVNPMHFLQKTNYYTSKKLKIVYVGVLGIAHGLFELCQRINFSELGAELYIYGDGFEYNSINEYLKLNTSKGVHLCGSLENKEVPQILANYDAALIPQKADIYGTFPAKTYEAMAVGLPILFHGGVAGRKLIKSENIGFTSRPNDWKQFSENILLMKNLSDVEMKKMGDKARILAENKFNRQKISSEFAKSLTKQNR